MYPYFCRIFGRRRVHQAAVSHPERSVCFVRVKFMTRYFVVPCGALACATILAAGSPSPDRAARQRFTSRAEAVQVDVLVIDHGRLVTGLSARDFDVRDDGVPQEVALVEVQRLPLNLICAFDTSGSVAGDLLRNLVDAAGALLHRMEPQDRLALLSFSNRVHLISGLTSDRAAIGAALKTLHAEGRTTLRDGTFAALALREEDRGRTLLLLFSDGRDTASWLTEPGVLEIAKRSDVVAYPVAVHQPADHEHEKFLDNLARETGGRVVVANASANLQTTFTAILAEFRVRYVLSYIPKGVRASGWHRLDVTLRQKSGTITARRGYSAD